MTRRLRKRSWTLPATSLWLWHVWNRRNAVNLKAIRWLLQHRDLLTKVVVAAQKFNPSGTYVSQWEVVDEIARLVIPEFEREGVEVNELLGDYFGEDEIEAFSMGAEVQALGIDWRQLIEVILPILLAILRALAPNE